MPGWRAARGGNRGVLSHLLARTSYPVLAWLHSSIQVLTQAIMSHSQLTKCCLCDRMAVSTSQPGSLLGSSHPCLCLTSSLTHALSASLFLLFSCSCCYSLLSAARCERCQPPPAAEVAPWDGCLKCYNLAEKVGREWGLVFWQLFGGCW
jgi:hypothetical protein